MLNNHIDEKKPNLSSEKLSSIRQGIISASDPDSDSDWDEDDVDQKFENRKADLLAKADQQIAALNTLTTSKGSCEGLLQQINNAIESKNNAYPKGGPGN